MRGMDAGGRFGGTKRQQRNDFGPPLQESRGKLRGRGDWEGASHSRIQREVVLQDGKSEFWDRDGRCPGG